MVLRRSLFALISVSVLVLGACSSNSSTTSDTASKPDTAASPAAATEQKDTDSEHSHADGEKGHDHAKEGDHSGQVIEVGQYHLEFIPSKEADGTHLDFILQKGESHEAIPNAKVTAQVQFPDGTQKTLDLKYEADAKHYGATLSSNLPGDYKVAILSDINGEKVNGRFSFKQ